MNGLKDLLQSERGIFSILLVLAATVLVVLGHFTAEQWETYTKWIAGFLIAGKTITTAVEAFSNRTPAPAAPSTSNTVVVENKGGQS